MASNLLRVTGMVSGMDTESIISMYASKTKSKLDTAKKSKIKNTYTQDAWKDINSKIYSFYSKTLSTNRLSSAYRKQKTTTSNGALSVTMGAGASNGVQEAVIKQTARAGYQTGAEISTKDGQALKGSDNLVEKLGVEDGSMLKFTSGGKETNIFIASSADTEAAQTAAADGAKVVTTMDQLVKTLQGAGVNANFDTANQRLFISSKDTGEANDFSLDAMPGQGYQGFRALSKLGMLTEEQVDERARKDVGRNATEEQFQAKKAYLESSWGTNYATKSDGQDAILNLNGADFKSATNNLTINGSTYTINYMPSNPDEKISVTTATDYDGVYDVVKNMLKEYNNLVNEMSKLYNADSAKGYEPLLAEEKEALSESEVKEWEDKVKGAILRKDSTLNDILSSVSEVMSQGVEVNGKKMYLSDFGISTQGYFEADANERYALHIDGDADDEVSAGNDDKLKGKIAADPDSVMSFFQQLSNNLYNKLFDKMSSNKTLSSIYKVYNDKQLASEATDWDSKIADLEQKVTDIEDKWYSKFSKMETKLAKLQKNQTAVSGFFS